MKIIFIIVTLGCGVLGDEVKSVIVGDPVTLHINLTDIHQDDKIQWMFDPEGANSLLAQIEDKKRIPKSVDKSFIGRLEINLQTGDLTIKNMRIKHSGRYKAVISRDIETSVSFNVNVKDDLHALDADPCEVKSVSVTEGESVTLHTDVQTHRDDLIVWRFGPKGVLIAKDDKEDNKISIYDVLDGSFRDRLKLDNQNGSLIITNAQTTDTGVYKVKISSNSKNTQKTFSVAVSDKGLSSGDVVGIVFAVLLAAVVGVISHRRINYELQKRKVQNKRMKEGDFVALHSHVTDLKSGDVIEWRFKETVIVMFIYKDEIKMLKNKIIKDRLQVDVQTGSLIIKKMRKEQAGLYKVKISSKSRVKSGIQCITGGGPSYSQFNVSVYEEKMTMDEKSVTLHPHTAIQSNDKIEWMFEDKVIILKGDSGNNISEYDGNDERFFGNLELQNETGSLTIKRVNRNVTGFYEVKITSITRTSYSLFHVINKEIRTAVEGESVTLEAGFYNLPKDTKIEWKFEDKVIMTGGTSKKNTISGYDGDDERFIDRMELNNIDGYLTIKNIEKVNGGLYTVNITTGKETSFLQYHVAVIDVMAFVNLFENIQDSAEEVLLNEAV